MILLHKLDQFIEKACVYLLTLALASMIGLTLINMALRWFSTTLLWIDPVVRYLVFACGFLGGCVATGMQKHIRIDALPRLLESLHFDRTVRWISRLISLFCIGSIGWLIYASYQFYLLERQFGKEEFLGIHSSTMVAIVPIGLTLILIRFAARLILSFDHSQKHS